MAQARSIEASQSVMLFKPKIVLISGSIKSIFDQYLPRVLDDDYFPSVPLDTLFVRLTATFLITNGETEKIRKKAESIIKRTSTNAADYQRLAELSRKVTEWTSIEVAHSVINQCCDYVLKLRVDKEEVVYHYIAKYIIKKMLCQSLIRDYYDERKNNPLF